MNYTPEMNNEKNGKCKCNFRVITSKKWKVRVISLTFRVVVIFPGFVCMLYALQIAINNAEDLHLWEGREFGP